MPHTHLLGGDHDNHASLTSLQELGVLLLGLTRTLAQLGKDGVELARNVRGVAIEHWRVVVSNALVLDDNHLGVEAADTRRGGCLGVAGNHTTGKLLHGQTLDVETNIVTRAGGGQLLVVHLNTLALSGQTGGGEFNLHAWLEETSLNTADGDSTDTLDLVHILEWQAERLVGGTARGLGQVKLLQQSLGQYSSCSVVLSMLVDFSMRLSPVQPEIGMNLAFLHVLALRNP